jgi:hypothetical protein
MRVLGRPVLSKREEKEEKKRELAGGGTLQEPDGEIFRGRSHLPGTSYPKPRHLW